MTSTAWSCRKEFKETYKREVHVVPTHAPVIRTDYVDAIFETTADKHAVVVADIVRRHKLGQPVLVGTTSVRESEQLSRRLRKVGVQHELLNAKHHAAEARRLRDLQKKVAIENESERQEILKYDIVVHAQREAIYAWRRRLVLDKEATLLWQSAVRRIRSQAVNQWFWIACRGELPA